MHLRQGWPIADSTLPCMHACSMHAVAHLHSPTQLLLQAKLEILTLTALAPLAELLSAMSRAIHSGPQLQAQQLLQW